MLWGYQPIFEQLANIIGLIFNTLCLRAVDASFFQVRVTNSVCACSHTDAHQDCTRAGAADDNSGVLARYAYEP